MKIKYIAFLLSSSPTHDSRIVIFKTQNEEISLSADIQSENSNLNAQNEVCISSQDELPEA